MTRTRARAGLTFKSLPPVETPMAATVEARFRKIGRFGIFSRGPAGTARLAGDGLVLAYDDGQSVRFRFADLKKVGLNTNNGLWTLYPKEGKKTHFQTTGGLFSVGDRDAGRRFNDALLAAATQQGLKAIYV